MSTHRAKNTLTFVAAPQSDSAPAKEREDAITVLDDMLIAASENRFMLGRESPGHVSPLVRKLKLPGDSAYGRKN